ncbi:hypothetical protein KP509_35G027000 [Ceratopteris richardii]|uniref:Uncharacterized protein n=1 Tax=Ceratopteris richardii TaxID=49495 RepID=A0A8T2QFF8_CERRI|nr:hypothetical protein KP509_35G027000 [Ceratopteris richardii]
MCAPRSSAPSSPSSDSTIRRKTQPSLCDHCGMHYPYFPTPVPLRARGMHACRSCANRNACRSNKVAFPRLQTLLSESMADSSKEIVVVPQLRCPSALEYNSAGGFDDPSTVCLADMVQRFLDEDVVSESCGRARCTCGDRVCVSYEYESSTLPNSHETQSFVHQHLHRMLEGITCCTSDPELPLLLDVARVVEAEAEDTHLREVGYVASNGKLLRASIMRRLRQEGYNAAICKSHWKHTDGLPEGDYEYIDVIMDENTESEVKHSRFIVDIDFKAQFEIARASKYYLNLLDSLPKLFVGRPERLKQVLKIMSNGALMSFKEQGLLLPPWRKYKYMIAKWLSSYRRTVNPERLQLRENALDLGERRELGDTAEPASTVASVNNAEAAQISSKKIPSKPTAYTTAMCAHGQLPTADLQICGGKRDKVSGIRKTFGQLKMLLTDPSPLKPLQSVS